MNKPTSFMRKNLLTDHNRGQPWEVIDAIAFINELCETQMDWHFDDDPRDCFSAEDLSDSECRILEYKAKVSREVLGEEALFFLLIDYSYLADYRRKGGEL